MAEHNLVAAEGAADQGSSSAGPDGDVEGAGAREGGRTYAVRNQKRTALSEDGVSAEPKH